MSNAKHDICNFGLIEIPTMDLRFCMRTFDDILYQIHYDLKYIYIARSRFTALLQDLKDRDISYNDLLYWDIRWDLIQTQCEIFNRGVSYLKERVNEHCKVLESRNTHLWLDENVQDLIEKARYLICCMESKLLDLRKEFVINTPHPDLPEYNGFQKWYYERYGQYLDVIRQSKTFQETPHLYRDN